MRFAKIVFIAAFKEDPTSESRKAEADHVCARTTGSTIAGVLRLGGVYRGSGGLTHA
jgi:hypothetical protein